MKPSFLKTFSFLSLLAILILTQGNNTLYSQLCDTSHKTITIKAVTGDYCDAVRYNYCIHVWTTTPCAFDDTLCSGLSATVTYSFRYPNQTWFVQGIDYSDCVWCVSYFGPNNSGTDINYRYDCDPECYCKTDRPIYNNETNGFKVEQNFPNPFNPNTTISFSIAKSDNVKLVVSDVLGKEVAVLVNEFKSAGRYDINFDASALSSGIYFYTLTSGNFTETKKMFLIK